MRKTKPEGPAEPLTPSQVADLTEVLSKGTTRLEIRDWAMFRIMIDTMLRVSDVVAIRVGDVTHGPGAIKDKFVWRQKKTGRLVHCQISDKTKEALLAFFEIHKQKNPATRLFQISPRQVQNRVKIWMNLIGVDAEHISPHSLRRTKPTEVYRQTGNLRAAQIMLGHSSIVTTAGYLGIERDQAMKVFGDIEM